MAILISNSLSSAVNAPSSSMPRASPPPVTAVPAPVATAVEPAAPSLLSAQVTSPELDQIQHAIERLKQSMKPALSNSLEFQIDKSTGKVVVMIMDAQTGQLVRQIPSQEVMAIADAIDRMQGRGGLVKQKA